MELGSENLVYREMLLQEVSGNFEIRKCFCKKGEWLLDFGCMRKPKSGNAFTREVRCKMLYVWGTRHMEMLMQEMHMGGFQMFGESDIGRCPCQRCELHPLPFQQDHGARSKGAKKCGLNLTLYDSGKPLNFSSFRGFRYSAC